MLTVKTLSGAEKTRPVAGMTVADTYLWAASEWEMYIRRISLVCNRKVLILHGIGTRVDNLCDGDGNLRVFMTLQLAACPEIVGRRRGCFLDAIEMGLDAYRNESDTGPHDERIAQLYKEL